MKRLLYWMKTLVIQAKLKKLERKPIYKKEYLTEDEQQIIIKTDCTLTDYEYKRIFEFVEEELYEETSLITTSRKIRECFFNNQKTVEINEKAEEIEVLILSI